MNRGALANIGQDAWTYTALEVRAVAASGTPVDPIFDYLGATIQSGTDSLVYNWARHNVDFDGTVTAQYQLATLGAGFSAGSGADAWVIRLPVPARRPVPGVRGEWPLGTAMAYKSFTGPNFNIACTPVLADPTWPQLRSDANSWFQVAVPYCIEVGTSTITGTAGAGEVTTVSHSMGFAPKAYDIHVVGTDPGPFASAAAGVWFVTNIDTDSFDVGAFNISSGGSLPFSYKVMAEPPTGNVWLGPRKPFYWAATPYYNLFVQLRYEAA